MPASTTEEQDDQVYDEDFEPVARFKTFDVLFCFRICPS
jgi:hypothetical protein